MHRHRRDRPQLLDTVVIGCAALLGAAALFLAAKKLIQRAPPMPVRPASSAPATPQTPPLESLAVSRTERPLDSVPPIELARTGRPGRKKVEVPVPK
ncbi:MAG: hypothetical protein HY748_14660 [Elusimicrobia bacterium]|nr:hypothetical protein [Elusimicrobiota bacterium]